jgi:hypothetical protein
MKGSEPSPRCSPVRKTICSNHKKSSIVFDLSTEQNLLLFVKTTNEKTKQFSVEVLAVAISTCFSTVCVVCCCFFTNNNKKQQHN